MDKVCFNIFARKDKPKHKNCLVFERKIAYSVV